MSTLREAITINTASGQLRGELFVGGAGYPMLQVKDLDVWCQSIFSITTIPHVWTPLLTHLR